jgi:hypothetical protein
MENDKHLTRDTEKLDVHNYAIWSRQMKFYLICKDLWDTITEPPPEAAARPATRSQASDSAATEPTPVSDALRKWKTRDLKALSLIGLNVAKHHTAMVASCTSAKEAWGKLKSIYQATNEARKLQLRGEMTRLRLGSNDSGEPLTKYFARAKELRDQLADVDHIISDDELRATVIAGLPKEYRNVTDFMSLLKEQPTMDELLSKMLPIEERMITQSSFPNINVDVYMSKRKQPPYRPTMRTGPAPLAHGNSGYRPPMQPPYPRQQAERQRIAPGPYQETIQYPEYQEYQYQDSEEEDQSNTGRRCYACNQYGHIARNCPNDKVVKEITREVANIGLVRL